MYIAATCLLLFSIAKSESALGDFVRQVASSELPKSLQTGVALRTKNVSVYVQSPGVLEDLYTEETASLSEFLSIEVDYTFCIRSNVRVERESMERMAQLSGRIHFLHPTCRDGNGE